MLKEKHAQKYTITKDVYLTVKGYKPKLRVIENPALQDFFYEYGEILFNEIEWFFLDAFIFSDDEEKQREFKAKYPKSNFFTRHGILITKLEMAYYGIARLFYEVTVGKEEFLLRYAKTILSGKEFHFWRGYILQIEDEQVFDKIYNYNNPKEISDEISKKIDAAYQKYCKIFGGPEIPDDVLTNIDKEIDFERDVLPNLRFFSKRDEAFLRAYYQEEIPQEDFALEDPDNKGLSPEEVKYRKIVRRYQRKEPTREAVQRLKYHIIGLKGKILALKKENGTDFQFDFEIYRSMVNSYDLPFLGDYYGVKNNFESSLGESSGNYSVGTAGILYPQYIKWQMQCLALSTYRLQNGVTKSQMFTRDAIFNHMLEHSDNMDDLRLAKYRGCIDMFDTEDIDDDIIFDLLQAREPEFFNIDTIDQNGVKSILSEWHNFLEPETVQYLMKRYVIDEIQEPSTQSPATLKKIPD